MAEIKLFKPLLLLRPVGSWCGFGLRDPSILCCSDGTTVLKQDKICIYFNGRDLSINEGGKTMVGRSWVSPCLTQVETETEPVFQDEDYAAQGSVILAKDEYWMFYSPGTDLGFRRAVSRDGKHWQKQERLLLKPQQFGCSRIGLPFVTKVRDYWFMLLEGIINRTFRIFAAVSPDGEAWEPVLKGQPIYSPGPGSWDAGGQANPSLSCLDQGKCLLLYNGHAQEEPSGWDLGALACRDPLNGKMNRIQGPILRRRDLKLPRGRLEGARLLRFPGQEDKLLFFALPGMDSYQNGAIYYCGVRIGI